MVLRLWATCVSLVQGVEHGHAVHLKDLHVGLRTSAAFDSDGHLNLPSDNHIILHNGHIDHKPTLDSLIGSPPDSKNIEIRTLTAARREAENSASVKGNANNMANAAESEATDIKKEPWVHVDRLESSIPPTMDNSLYESKTSIENANVKESSGLADARTSIPGADAAKALKFASADDIHEMAVPTRSSGEIVATSTLQQASDAKARGDTISFQLSDTGKSGIQAFNDAKDVMTASGINTMDALIKAVPPVETAELPQGIKTNRRFAAVRDSTGSHTMGLLAFSIVLCAIVAGTVAKETYCSKT